MIFNKLMIKVGHPKMTNLENEDNLYEQKRLF